MRVSTFVAPKDLSKAIDLSLEEIAKRDPGSFGKGRNR